MARPKLVALHPEKPDMHRPAREGKRYKFDLSRGKFIFLVTGLVVTLCWMFILGVLVGRGIALVSAEDFSLRAEFMRFIGLGKQTTQPAPKAAETWGDPKKMLESLNYYEDLTRKGTADGLAAIPKPSGPEGAEPAPPLPPLEPPVKETVSKRQAQSQAPPEKTVAPEPEKPTKAAPTPAPAPPAPISGEQYTLLVASLKDPENAQKLLEELNRKGYSPRIETLDLHGAGRWSRVLVGTFQSREAALKFAADFNRKENKEGLVIRESN